MLTSHAQDQVTEIVKMYYDRPSLLHTLNIIRWYGLYRNGGVYNVDLYLSVYEKIKSIVEI